MRKQTKCFRASVLFILLVCAVFQTGNAQSKRAELPYRLVSNKMIVEIDVDGTKLPMIFDTGGTMGIVDSVCDQLELKKIGDITVTDVTGNNITYPKMQINKLTIPGSDMVFDEVPIMKMSRPSPVERFGAVGLVGSDLWTHSIVRIDPKKQVIVITSAEDTVAVDARYKTPFTDPKGIWPVFPCHIGGQKINLLFDSGAYGLFSLKESEYRNLYSYNETKLLDRGAGIGPSGVGGTFTPWVERKRIRLSPLKIGAATLEDIVVDELTTARNNIIGVWSLNYGEVIIDYSRRLFYFIPYEETAQVDHEFRNIEFMGMGDKLVVKAVWGDLRRQVKVGNEILEINGKPASHYDRTTILMKGLETATKKKKNTLLIKTRNGNIIVKYDKMRYTCQNNRKEPHSNTPFLFPKAKTILQ